MESFDDARPNIAEPPVRKQRSPARLKGAAEARAFAAPVVRPLPEESAVDGDVFESRLARDIARKLSANDCAVVIDIQHLAQDAAALARDGRIDAAASRLVAAQRRLEASDLDALARGLAESLLWALEAQVETEAGRFVWAGELLDAAFERALQSEDAGFSVMLAHRILLVGALMRLDGRRGRADRAEQVCGQMLRYLDDPTRPPADGLAPLWREGWRNPRPLLDARMLAELHRRISEDQRSLAAPGRAT